MYIKNNKDFNKCSFERLTKKAKKNYFIKVSKIDFNNIANLDIDRVKKKMSFKDAVNLTVKIYELTKEK